MIEQILLCSDSLDGMREAGSFGQPLHTFYPQIRSVLVSELGPDARWLLAEPIVDQTGSRIDWYTEGNPEELPVLLADLSGESHTTALEQLEAWLDQGRALAKRYLESEKPGKLQLGAILQTVLLSPAESDVFRIGERLIIIRWGLTPDQPWEMPALSARHSGHSVSEPVSTPEDSVAPDLTTFKQAAATTTSTTGHAIRPDSAVESTPTDMPAATPATIANTASPQEPVATPPFPKAATEEVSPPPKPIPRKPPAIDTSSPKSSLTSTLKPAAASDTTDRSSPATSTTTPLHYIVVGSRYFWGVVAVAILLVVTALFWPRQQNPVSHHIKNVTTKDPQHEALRHAIAMETVLNERLAQLQKQLDDQRAQCSNPATDTTAETPAAVTATRTTQEKASSSPTTSVATSEDSKPTHNTQSTIAPDPATTRPNTESNYQQTTPPDSKSASTLTLEAALAEDEPSAHSDSLQSPANATQPSSTRLTTASNQTLEPPPVAVIPTPEESREFADRLSEAGATAGEITVTLLWNSHADLDLVIRCPASQQLDYKNPANCGGNLDVDANTARHTLRERPVENIFWPTGQAKPGTYHVIVRYTPRKDEKNPQKTNFQVRLSQNTQKSVFKGTVRPRSTTLVTTFSVNP
ncbi:MAG: hypothetical protein CSA09_04010 [Candidatus Contendobacter odensis]|uniref:DUF2135 domain-containing protein n=1 Tax=Candidatus Contendibacter odensensis TaxID=1400860 RepID=A0A2G6PEH3_9GAMM|nr:MAG: hypothetical protein CSA09_04010 [Candidatus Contendobacter odensis]